MLERYVFLLDHYTVTPASSHGARAAVTQVPTVLCPRSCHRSLRVSSWGPADALKPLQWTLALSPMRSHPRSLPPSSASSQNVAEKGLDSVLDLVSSSSSPSLLRALYDTTLARLEGGEESGREGRAEGGARRRNQRLWFKTNLKLGHLLLSEAMQKEGGEHRAWRLSSLLLPLVSGSIPSCRGNPLILTLHCLLSPSFLPSEESVRLLGRLQRLIKDLLKSCEGPLEGPGEDGSAGGDTIKRGTQLLEVYALQMQLFALQKDSRKLKVLPLLPPSLPPFLPLFLSLSASAPGTRPAAQALQPFSSVALAQPLLWLASLLCAALTRPIPLSFPLPPSPPKLPGPLQARSRHHLGCAPPPHFRSSPGVRRTHVHGRERPVISHAPLFLLLGSPSPCPLREGRPPQAQA